MNKVDIAKVRLRLFLDSLVDICEELMLLSVVLAVLYIILK